MVDNFGDTIMFIILLPKCNHWFFFLWFFFKM